ncbi:MAG: DUF2793 domain-containing protein [Sulfitobacter sp.]|uniref:DUF2793 domain-containing protein n=1 Tax=Sulfitobacter sp. TaxID=1903071 RepID=UPI004058A6BD
MPDKTPRLDFLLLLPSQAQKHVTRNGAPLLLDMITQLTFTTFEESDPPTAPEGGEVHVVGDPANGDWVGQVGKIARFDGNGWALVDPQ